MKGGHLDHGSCLRCFGGRSNCRLGCQLPCLGHRPPLCIGPICWRRLRLAAHTIDIITIITSNGAMCVCRQAAIQAHHHPCHLLTSPDPSKTHSTVGMVLSIYNAPRQSGPTLTHLSGHGAQSFNRTPRDPVCKRGITFVQHHQPREPKNLHSHLLPNILAAKPHPLGSGWDWLHTYDTD